MLVVVALVALCWVGTQAQSAGQKPPETKPKPEAQAPAKDAQAKPAEAPKAPELTADQKAFNAIAEEKDPQKRLPLYEKFIADYPTSMGASLARSEIQRATLAALKSAGTKYQDSAKTEIETARKSANPTQISSTYSRFASELLSAGVMLAEAEDYGRQAVSLMDEQKYVDYQKQMAQTRIDTFAKQAANPTATPATPPGGGGFAIRSVNGAPTFAPMPPRTPPAATTPPRPRTAPQMPTDESLRATFKSMRASTLATLGQVLMKRDKTAEGEKVLKEAFDLKPASGTTATIARILGASAKKAGNDAAQFEYLTVLALSGGITADEQKDHEALYRKTHNGTLDGLEAMLDVRYAKENPTFSVTPANRKPAPNQRAVLVENFTGSG
jgi:hypothetical protein